MKWHKTTDIRDNPLIAETSGPYCLFWPREGRLFISEQGKYMDDHAVVVFEGLEQEEAEFIISKLKDVRTQ
jgi:hypothetical protein